MWERHTRPVLGVLLIVTLLGVLSGPASAQEVRAGGSITVPEGTVHEGDLTVVGGSVVIDGTVEGSIHGVAGSVVVSGTVTDDVEIAAGSITVGGTVGGDVESGGGSVTVLEGGRIDGWLETGAGSLTIDGQVGGDVRADVSTLTVGETARIGGDLTYAAETVAIAGGATIGGTTQEVDSLALGTDMPILGDIGTGFVVVFGFLANLLLGIVLLVAAPGFARQVADNARTEPLRSGVAGLLVLIGIPVALAVVAITVVGIPLSIAGLVTFPLVLWIGFVYGAYVTGSWLLSLAGYSSRWGALLVGLAVPALLSLFVLGDLLSLVYLLIGLGSVALAVLDRRRGRGQPEGVEESAPETRTA